MGGFWTKTLRNNTCNLSSQVFTQILFKFHLHLRPARPRLLGLSNIFYFYQILPEFPFSTRHFLCSFIFELEWGQFDCPIRCFFILLYTTRSHFKILSISEIIYASALGFLQTIDSHSMIVDRKVKPEAESEQKEIKNFYGKGFYYSCTQFL